MAISWFTVGVLTIVCVLLVIVVVFQTKKLITHIKNTKEKPKKDALVRRVALACRIISLIVPLIILIFYAGYYEFRWQYTQYIATNITRHVAGRNDVTARCTRRLSLSLTSLPIGPEGFVEYGATHSDIGYSSCRSLATWLMSDRQEMNNGVGLALHVIIHEAVHLSGEKDESQVECKSIMMHEDVAFETLGIDREASRRFIKYYKERDDPVQLALGYTVDWKECEASENAGTEQKSNDAPDEIQGSVLE